MLRALEGRNDGIKIEVLDYAGNLKPEELIDWLNSMEKFFEWKPMMEEKKVKFACTKLKGHAMIWWDHVQKDRTKKGKEKIGEKVVRKILASRLCTKSFPSILELEAKPIHRGRTKESVLPTIHSCGSPGN